MILPVVQFPAEILKQPSKPVENFNDQLKQLASNMLDTLEHHKAFGLSAVQVGVPLRMFVISKTLNVPAVLFINPQILAYTPATTTETEGCLSIANGASTFRVRRAKSIKVKFINSYMDEINYEVFDLASRVMQHELDHLDGKLILDFAELIRA